LRNEGGEKIILKTFGGSPYSSILTHDNHALINEATSWIGPHLRVGNLYLSILKELYAFIPFFFFFSPVFKKNKEKICLCVIWCDMKVCLY